MITSSENILNAVNEVQILSCFKLFCQNNITVEDKLRLRNIYALSNDKIKTTASLIKMDLNIILNEDESRRMYQLINAFLHKTSFRKTIDFDTKNKLLIRQHNQCAFCKSPVTIRSHVDHVVPFKYVGDQLEDNLQMLCFSCNLKKNDSLDYQIKVLLKLI